MNDNTTDQPTGPAAAPLDHLQPADVRALRMLAIAGACELIQELALSVVLDDLTPAERSAVLDDVTLEVGEVRYQGGQAYVRGPDGEAVPFERQ